jgi:hypothetical protein
MRPKTIAQLERQCADWNAAHKPGTLVQYREVLGTGQPVKSTTRSEAQVLGGHTAVVWLVGKVGCVALDHCDPHFDQE